MRPIATACAVAALLCGAALAYASLRDSPDPAQAPRKQKALTITGSVEDLQPGVPAVLTAVVRNRTTESLKLRSVSARIGDASPGCPATLLRTESVRLRGSVRARRTRKVPIEMTLLPSAPDECQDAVFPLRFNARAKRVPSRR